MVRHFNTICFTFLMCTQSITAQNLDVVNRLDQNFINWVKILRGERTIFKSKAVVGGALIGTGAGLASGANIIKEPQMTIGSPIQFDPLRIEIFGESSPGDYAFERPEQKAAIIGGISALLGSGVGAIYTKIQKYRILNKINTLLQAYTSYHSFNDLTLAESALLYAAYLQNLGLLRPLAHEMSDFLNKRGVFNVVTTLFFNQHASHDLMAALKERLDIPQLQFTYMPDILAKPSWWQSIKETGQSGVAKVKSGFGAVGSGISNIAKKAAAPFQLNYISSDEANKYMDDPVQFKLFLEHYNPNIYISTFGGYVTGRNATPILGYALWNGKQAFADFLIDNGAKLEDTHISSQSLFKNNKYSNYIDLALDKKLFLVVQKLLDKGFKIDESTVKRTFIKKDPDTIAYALPLFKNSSLLQPDVSPLAIAIQIQDMDMAKQFLDPAYINKAGSKGNTPLHIATEKSNASLVALLLNNGASPHAKNENGNTPLHITKNSAIAQLLIQNGADIMAKNNSGEIPLIPALSSNNASLIQLLSKGIDLATRDAYNNSLLHHSIAVHNTEFTETLLNKAPQLINATNNNGDTPLAFAIKNKKNDLAKKLIAHNASINTQNKQGRTPLLEGIMNDNIEGALLLLQHNANPNLADNNSDTPLAFAIKNKKNDLAKKLIAHNASINTQNKQGKTPLFEGIMNNNTEGALLLLQHNADPNLANYQGEAPLNAALNRKQFQVADKLIQQGANLNKTDSSGNYPLHIALEHESPHHIIQKLITNYSINAINNDGKIPLELAQDNAIFNTLLQNYANPNVPLQGNSTILHKKASNFDLDKITSLLRYGARIDSTDSYGNTPLHVALKALPLTSFDNAIPIIKILTIPHIVNLKNSSGETPLILAAKIPHAYRSKSIIQALYQFGANPNIKDGRGKYPYEYARDIEIKKLLGYNPPPPAHSQQQQNSSQSTSSDPNFPGYPQL